MFKTYLKILGVVTLSAALAWWPLGVGELGSTSLRIEKNYADLVARGIAKPDTSAAAVLMRGFERSISADRARTAVLLGVLGVSLLLAARRIRRLDNQLAGITGSPNPR